MIEGLRNAHVFVRLNRDIPLRVRFGVLHDCGHHRFGDAPFGLQVEPARWVDLCRIAFGPCEVLLCFDDYFQFVGPFECFGQWGVLAFGRQTHPIELSAERVGSGGLQKDLQTPFMQFVGQRPQRIEQWLAACDDDGLGGVGRSAVDDRPDVDRRIEFRIPRVLGVAPSAADVASAQPDEVGRFSGMVSLSLIHI